MLEQIRKILNENQDKRICVLGTTCTGKTTLLKSIPDGADMDELIFPLLTPEEAAYVNQEPWTKEIGNYMDNLVRTKLHIEKGKPIFGTVLIDCDLIVYLDIDDELLQERTTLRGANFENAKNMKKSIESEVVKANIPCIKIPVISNLKRNLNILQRIICRVNAPVRYVISGSTSLAFQGVDVIPNDIDIFTDKEGVEYFYSILQEYTTEPPKTKETDIATSHYIKSKIDGVKVEVIGDFKIKNTDGSYKPSTIDWDNLIFKNYQGIEIPLMSLLAERNGYDSMGRTEKVQKIDEILSEIKIKSI